MSLPAASRLFLILCAVSLAVWWRVLLGTLQLAMGNDAYTHILLILPISTGLVILRLRGRTSELKPSPRAGALLLLLAALIGIAGLKWAPVDTASFVGLRWSVEMLALVTWWMGAFVLCFGARLARACAFPLLFLLWLVPMPEMAVANVIAFLQQETASMTRAMFAVIGVPVTQSGTVVSVPGLSVQVAEECSSIRSSMILIVLATVMACLMLRSYWTRAIVVALSIPLAVAKNALRVFTLQGLGAYVDPAILNSPLHHQGGVLFLAMAVAVLYAVIRLMLRLEIQGEKPGVPANATG